MRALVYSFVTILSLVAASAQAGSMRRGLSTKPETKIGYVEIVPANTPAKFAIFFSAENKRYLIIDKDNKTVEFNYSDAIALRNDILKTSVGMDAGMTIGCQEQEIQINGFVSGCQLVLPFEYK